jgi:thiosulfate dehydrogenase
MRTKIAVGTTVAAAVLGAALMGARGAVATDPGATPGGTTVELCDGKTTVEVAQNTPPSREQGQHIADELMAKWKANNPGTDWVDDEKTRHALVPPADNSDLVGRGQGQTYGRISKEDVLVWQRETLAMVARGSQVFHSGQELGSTVGVSCDMCHPNAANTHPETYPKYQVQLGRTVLLRDMINWCIQHPVRGVKLAEDDPRMRALEAYILSARKGTPLNYGRR